MRKNLNLTNIYRPRFDLSLTGALGYRTGVVAADSACKRAKKACSVRTAALIFSSLKI